MGDTTFQGNEVKSNDLPKSNFLDKDKINQTQFYDLITSEELSWQTIIYDLVRTEQLDPWDINIEILAEKYLVIIQQIEEADFFISSKVLLACSLLLRLKSEILKNEYIQSLDEILYGKKEEKKYELERIEINDDELPILVPRSPIPRHKKVTLKELISALNKSVNTENRRIKKEIRKKQAEKSALVVLPSAGRVPLKTRIKGLFLRIKNHLNPAEKAKMKYSELAPSKEEKLSSFVPILHLSNQEKIYLHQEIHFDEIYMTLERMQEEIEELEKIEELEGEEEGEIINQIS